MMKNSVWMLALALTLTACSGKKANNVSQDTPQIELSDTAAPEDEFMDTSAPGDSAAASSEPSDVAVESELTAAGDSAPVIAAEEPINPAEEVPAEVSSPNQVTLTGNEGLYTVQKNETLMMIAFKLYGDYGKWRDIAARNRAMLKSGQPTAGMKLKYAMPSETFVWKPQGNPHLIRTGETLGKISGQVYGTQKKWKFIWDNNRPLIKDPNKIFAGFTLYWLQTGKVAQNSASLEL